MGSEWRDYMREARRLPSAPRPARATWSLIGASTLLWFLYAGSRSWGGLGGLHTFVERRLLLDPEAVLESFAVWQPLTAIFFHDPNGLGSVLLNMALLFLLGRAAEAHLGSRGLVALHLLGGLAGTVAVVATSVLFPVGRVAFGASGSVLAMATFLAFRSGRRGVRLGSLRLPFGPVVLAFLAGVEALALLALGQPPATTAGHAAGAIWGVLHHLLVARPASPRPPRPVLAVRRGGAAGSLRPHGSTDETALRERVDALLAKIHSGGIESLSRDEKEFLQEASKEYR